MSMKEYNLKIEIGDIDVIDGYYTFDFKAYLGKKLVDKGEINDDFENGMTDKEWKRELQNGEALRLVIEQLDL